MKKKIIALLIGVLAIVGVSAGLLEHFGTVEQTVTVTQAVVLSDGGGACSGNVCSETETAAGGETRTSVEYTITSATSVDIPLLVSNSYVNDSGEVDSGIESMTNVYNLHAAGNAGTEDRIRVEVSDIDGLTDLNSLTSISFMQNVLVGYIGHVDLYLANGKTLIFEYDKIKSGADCGIPEGGYPEGIQDTFGDRGFINDNAYAWENGPIPGPCGDEDFEAIHKSLTNWKSDYGTIEIVAIEFEIDNWIPAMPIATTEISNLKVNGMNVDVITIQAGKTIDFNVETKFANGAVGVYTITTNVEVQ